MKSKCLLILVLLVLTTGTIVAEERVIIGGLDGLDPYGRGDDYSVLMALSGGGARGLTAIGIFKAFEEKGISIDAIAGTSMGGIIGGLYASGYSPDRLASIVTRVDFNNLFSNAPSRMTMFLTQRQERDRHLLSVRFDGYRPIIPKALTAGQKLTAMLTALTTRANYRSAADFRRLPIPFNTVSTDIVTGKAVIHSSGSMADAMSATMAYPLAFAGVDQGDQILMDGGMVMPVPVDLVRSMSDSVDYVVAVNTTSKLVPKEELLTVVDIASQVTSIMTADQLADQLSRADYIVAPPIDDFISTDFRYKDSLVEIGYRAGLSAADSIIAAIEARRENHLLRIDSVTVEGGPPEVRQDISSTLAGSILSGSELLKRIKELTIVHNLWRVEAEMIVADSDSSDTTGARLHLAMTESARWTDVSFVFSGNTAHSVAALAEQMASSDVFVTPRSLTRAIDRLINLYTVEGYDLVDVKTINFDPAEKEISVDIDEAIIRRIDVENDGRTRDWFIRSYFSLRSGHPYSTSRASRGVANIYGTDLFDRVALDVRPVDSGAAVTIKVDEKKFNQLRLGWHWHDEYKSEVLAEFLDDNVAGIGLQYLLSARLGPDRKDLGVSFKTNRIFSTYLTSSFRLHRRTIDRAVFDDEESESGLRKETKTGAEISVGQQIKRFGTVSAGITVEEVEYKYADSDQKEKFGLRTINIQSRVENFDRISFPTSGKQHIFRLNLAGEYLGGKTEFTKFFSSIEAYFPMGELLNYHPKMSIGLSRSGLPPSEQFFIGGAHSFVGFRTDQLAGDKMFLFSQEGRVKLPLHLYLTVRWDLGEVYQGADQIKLRNLRHGVGAFLAVDSPIGPVEAGFGVADSDVENAYINVGLSF